MSAQLSTVMSPQPIRFDRASGALEGANLWERTAAVALATGSKISSHFSHRGYISCANLLRKTLPERNIAIKLNADAKLTDIWFLANDQRAYDQFWS